VTKPFLVAVPALMVLFHLVDVYALPLLSTMVQGVPESAFVKSTVVPGVIGDAA
jgi:hypothetical protein